MRNPKIILLFLLFIVVIGGAIFTWLAKVNKILCKTQYGPCSKIQEEIFEEFKGQRLLLLGDKVEKRALVMPGVRDVTLIKRVSGALEVVLTFAKPLIALQIDGQENYYLVDIDGTVVGRVASTPLPKIVLPPSYLTVSQQNPNLSYTIKVVDLLFRARRVTETKFLGRGITFNIDGAEVIFPVDTTRDPQVLVGSLQFILTRSTIEGKNPVKIDLRFKNPVVVF